MTIRLRRTAQNAVQSAVPSHRWVLLLRLVLLPEILVNEYLLSVLLGIVEGLTEFLPVSSTAHLRIVEAWCKVPMDDGFWKMYTIVIQLGAILCLPIYFRHRLWSFLKTFPNGEHGDRTAWNHPLTLVLIAFVTTALPAYALTKVIGKNLESLIVMGSALFIGGAVMWAVDFIFGTRGASSAPPLPGFEVVGSARGRARGFPVSGLAAALNPDAEMVAPIPHGFHPTEHIEGMNVAQAIWIGAAQILSAVFPGTSRSMSTIAAGQVAGMTRPSALEFSFLLSIPTMIAATGYDFLKTVVLHKGEHKGETLPPIHLDGHHAIVLLIGFVISFFVAWGVVAWFMAWVRRRGFTPFAIYRLIVGAAVLVWAVKRHG